MEPILRFWRFLILIGNIVKKLWFETMSVFCMAILRKLNNWRTKNTVSTSNSGLFPNFFESIKTNGFEYENLVSLPNGSLGFDVFEYWLEMTWKLGFETMYGFRKSTLRKLSNWRIKNTVSSSSSCSNSALFPNFFANLRKNVLGHENLVLLPNGSYPSILTFSNFDWIRSIVSSVKKLCFETIFAF